MLTQLRDRTKALSVELQRISSGKTRDFLEWYESLSFLLDGKPGQSGQSIKKILFMVHEFGMNLPPPSEAKSERVAFLRKLSLFLFEQKGFSISQPGGDLYSDGALLLPDVLREKSGDSRIVGLIYKTIAEEFGFHLDLLNVPDSCILRAAAQESNIYVDIGRDGTVLSSTELLHRMNGMGALSECLGSEFLEPFQPLNLVFVLLDHLKAIYSHATAYEKHLVILDLLIHQQMARIQSLGERAIILAKMGLKKEALVDLKRYFSFNEMDYSPAEIVKTFKKLRASDPRHRKSNLRILE